MPALLFEIGCEELPARAVREAAEQLPRLAQEHLGVAPSRLYLGPRRLALVVDDLPDRTPDEWIKGPPVALRERAAEGFARRHGVPADDLVERDGFLGVDVPGRPVGEVLPGRLDALVRAVQFGKSMRWDESGIRFARPVRWLLGKLDEQTIVGDGTTEGHRFAGGGRVSIPSPAAYADVLRASRVEPDPAERERLIREGLDALGEWRDPGGVMREVVHLVEWPAVLEGRFDERFLELPEAVAVTAMQSHQRYFPLDGNRFAFVANGGRPEVVRAGNERVLEGRLDDAHFTFRRDLAVGIEGLREGLGSITYLAGAGTFAEKSDRLADLVGRLGGDETTREAARLAKADQAAELVREFPELEGTIGAEYARRAGVGEDVAAAIAEHHLPDGEGAPLPSTPAGRIVSAADKLDTLTVAFEHGHRPTGSRDPLGLRRAAIGLARLADEGGVTVAREDLQQGVRDFVDERLEGLLDVPVEFVRAACRSGVSTLGSTAALARALAALDDERLDRMHEAYTRTRRIAGDLADAEPWERSLLTDEAELALADALERTAGRIAGVDADADGALAAAGELAAPLDRFFTDVLVMAEDAEVRRNRLRLLLDVSRHLKAVGDLSLISR